MVIIGIIFIVTVKKCVYMLFNIMVIIEIALFLLVVKNPSARKAIKSSHYSSKK